MNRLPFYGPKQIRDVEYRGKIIKDTVFHEIPAVTISGYQGDTLNTHYLSGYIHIAHFIDMNVLDSIPPQIVYTFSEVLADHKDVYAVSYLRNYQGETLRKPSSYSTKLDNTDTLWNYFTGPADSLETLLAEGYFPGDESGKNHDVHSVVLVDKEGRIRGYYNPVVAEDIKRLTEDVKYLKREYARDYKTHRYYKYNEKLEQRK